MAHRTQFVVFVALAAVVAVPACRMETLPLSVQAGSTVTVAIGDAGLVDQFGYGGFNVETGAELKDHQRGQIVIKLEEHGLSNCTASTYACCPGGGQVGCYLPVASAAQAVGVESTEAARIGSGILTPEFHSSGRNVIVIFDIPVDTPPGDYTLAIYRRKIDRITGAPEPEANYELIPALSTAPANRKLSILPNALDPDVNYAECGPGTAVDPCSLSAIVGKPTPFDYWAAVAKTGFIWRQNGFNWSSNAYPSPELILDVTTVSAQPWALEFNIDYDPAQIVVLDVVPPIAGGTVPNDRPLVFFSDDDLVGQVQVKVIGAFDAITKVALVFDLVVDTGAIPPTPQFTPLDHTMDSANGGVDVDDITLATDENGVSIIDDVTIVKLGIL